MSVETLYITSLQGFKRGVFYLPENSCKLFSDGQSPAGGDRPIFRAIAFCKSIVLPNASGII
ncbi:hypothetical protein [Anabaena sp. CCY 0017]|uniref:hypothetical protein n=1 Tax=Anabaena sp. CCY 0017 TaxID=3103866 RepID=UPI0039C71829